MERERRGGPGGGRDGQSEAWPGRAFTLVEVLVAIAITSVVSLAIYSIFAQTTESMQEAESLATTVNDAQFGAGRIRSAFRNAAALGTPDSDHDSWVAPDPRGQGTAIRVAGLVSYDGWQDSRSPLPKTSPNLRKTNKKTDQLKASYDGIIVIGAVRFPSSFEVGDVAADGTGAKIFATERGLHKLKLNNPFDVQTGPRSYDFQESSAYESILGRRTGRPDLIGTEILRISDRHGYRQFTGIADASRGSSTGSGLVTDEYLQLEFDHALYRRQGSDRYGLQPVTQQDDDVSYEASLLDAFWYHVRRDPADPGNLRLVRERLDGGQLIEDGLTGDWSDLNPGSYRAYGSEDYAVLVENVADFQIWFDCASEGGEGNAVDAEWEMGWKPPDGSGTAAPGASAGHNCLNPDEPDPGRARLAHIRLSLRTRTEQDDLSHDPFTARSQSGSHVRMGTFDADGDPTDAAAVYTMQVDLELPNFAARNIR